MVDLFGRLGGGVEMNGSEDAVEKMLTFDAQKGKGNHVRYILGKSKMLLGFCEGLPTMLKGEVAMFKIKPKLHYAKDDCTLKASDGFPKDDELHFEIEMLDFYKVKVSIFMSITDCLRYLQAYHLFIQCK
ncbi:Peptidylprolyl isomerase protein [Dioscorea alata]|uniref:Peptidylprolyl isomerase protein n=1 Tax=Dioscorea alata TaxID=55571 RepID=A0ACB7UCA5_DIOAL|nr:Peptidylprolyl isomerase protein [Dioscorea alata]